MQECAVNHPQGHSQETNHQARKRVEKNLEQIVISGLVAGVCVGGGGLPSLGTLVAMINIANKPERKLL